MHIHVYVHISSYVQYTYMYIDIKAGLYTYS